MAAADFAMEGQAAAGGEGGAGAAVDEYEGGGYGGDEAAGSSAPRPPPPAPAPPPPPPPAGGSPLLEIQREHDSSPDGQRAGRAQAFDAASLREDALLHGAAGDGAGGLSAEAQAAEHASVQMYLNTRMSEDVRLTGLEPQTSRQGPRQACYPGLLPRPATQACYPGLLPGPATRAGY